MMADPTWQYINHPHRKPLPPHLQPQPSPTSSTSSNLNVYSHSRTRTTSSNIFPIPQPATQGYYPSTNNTMLSGTFTSRRTPSTNTFSTTGSSAYANRNPSSDIPRRSTSRGSSAAPTSYVALMRKQKATVWCDRAQAEDPRLLAAQKAAKIRAASEVMGAYSGRTSTISSTGLSSTNRVAAKIRHHGKSGLTGYQAASENFGVGVGGVPMRLSASEVEGGDSDDENYNDDRTSSGIGMYHHRTGSGRSSLGSERRRTGLQYRPSGTSGHSSGRWSNGNTPPSERNGSGLGERGNTPNDSLNELAEETPMPAGHVRAKDYFSADGSLQSTRSGGSGSSGERADALGELGLGGGSEAARLASDSLLKSTMTREKSTRNPEELRRRGSVDERTMTITGGVGRLFVANPDVDSDED